MKYIFVCLGLSSSWSYGNLCCNYVCNQCLSPHTFEFPHGELYSIQHCDKVCQWLAAGWWFSKGTPISCINKTDRHDITGILLKVALNTITLTQ